MKYWFDLFSHLRTLWEPGIQFLWISAIPLCWPLPLSIPNIIYTCPKLFLLALMCTTLFHSPTSEFEFVWGLLSLLQPITSLSCFVSTPQSCPSTIRTCPQPCVALERNGPIFRSFSCLQLHPLSLRGLMTFMNMGCVPYSCSISKYLLEQNKPFSGFKA